MTLEERIEALERRSRRYASATIVLGITLVTLLVSGFSTRSANSEHGLRAKGLVIEDAQGRPRVLLEAPFPDVRERIRSDAASTAMIFLDEQGHDRLTLGEAPPAQLEGKVSKTHRRIGSSFGVIIHDLKGNERGGLSFLSNGRAALAFDYPGRDAIFSDAPVPVAATSLMYKCAIPYEELYGQRPTFDLSDFNELG